jgi:signal peptidase I
MKTALSSLYEIIKTVTFVLLTAFLIRYFLIQPFVVEGQSMEPNFHNNEYLIIDKLSYKFHEPNRGDIIIFQAPNAPQYDYIKRVIGRPGETIKIANNKIYINNQPIDETYLQPNERTLINQDPKMTMERTLGPNEFFVLGDNRQHSSDSREFGILDKSKILGRVWVTVYPWDDFSLIHNPSYSN